jgi:hypothetical protein
MTHGDDSDSEAEDEEEDGYEVSPMTALISGPKEWILSTCLSIALIAADPSHLLYTDSATAPRWVCKVW